MTFGIIIKEKKNQSCLENYSQVCGKEAGQAETRCPSVPPHLELILNELAAVFHMIVLVFSLHPAAFMLKFLTAGCQWGNYAV